MPASVHSSNPKLVPKLPLWKTIRKNIQVKSVIIVTYSEEHFRCLYFIVFVYIKKEEEIKMKATMWSKGSSPWPPPAEKTNMQGKLNKQKESPEREDTSQHLAGYLHHCVRPLFLHPGPMKGSKRSRGQGLTEVVPAGCRISGWSCRELLALVWQLLASPRARKQPHIDAWQWLGSRRQRANTLATPLKADRCLHYREE